jgi:hypothetical protein
MCDNGSLTALRAILGLEFHRWLAGLGTQVRQAGRPQEAGGFKPSRPVGRTRPSLALGEPLSAARVVAPRSSSRAGCTDVGLLPRSSPLCNHQGRTGSCSAAGAGISGRTARSGMIAVPSSGHRPPCPGRGTDFLRKQHVMGVAGQVRAGRVLDPSYGFMPLPGHRQPLAAVAGDLAGSGNAPSEYAG